jgi:tetratricopeptide (TPR) repeat protein
MECWMGSVFLSYSREDLERIRPLAAALEKAGHQVWWDRQITGGEEYAGVIEQALESAEAVVVAWTAASVKSAWVRDEAGQARDTGRLIPITLDGCQPPLGFRQYQTIDLSKWNRRAGSPALAPLLQAIDKATGRPSTPDQADQRLTSVPFIRGPVSRQAALAAALVLLLLGGAGILYPRMAESGPISPKIALGEFALVSPDLPKHLPEVIDQEVLAAFGAENAVAVLPDPGRSSKSAPFVMDGSIGKEGPTVRYTVNLKNSRSGVLLWSQAYDRDAADTLAPRQVAVEASQVVRCGLWGAAAYKRRMSDEGLSLYLKWCNAHWGGSTDDAAELDAARAVTAAVPDFSFGWSARALAAVPLAQQATSADAPQMAAESRDAAQRSIKLDDQNPEGYMALAGLLPLSRYAEREQLLKKAISVRRLECGCERLSYGDFLTSVGRIEEAVDEYQRGQAKMPLAPFSNVRLAQALYEVGRHEEADRVLSETADLWPDASDVELLKVKSAFWTKRYDTALAALHSPELHLGREERDALVAAFEALKGAGPDRRAQAIALLEQCANDPKQADRLIVGALAALGDGTAAVVAAQRLIANKGHRYADVLFEPNLASARQSPAYALLVNRLGLASYWRSHGHVPDVCSKETRPSFCAAA